MCTKKFLGFISSTARPVKNIILQDLKVLFRKIILNGKTQCVSIKGQRNIRGETKDVHNCPRKKDYRESLSNRRLDHSSAMSGKCLNMPGISRSASEQISPLTVDFSRCNWQ